MPYMPMHQCAMCTDAKCVIAYDSKFIIIRFHSAVGIYTILHKPFSCWMCRVCYKLFGMNRKLRREWEKRMKNEKKKTTEQQRHKKKKKCSFHCNHRIHFRTNFILKYFWFAMHHMQNAEHGSELPFFFHSYHTTHQISLSEFQNFWIVTSHANTDYCGDNTQYTIFPLIWLSTSFIRTMLINFAIRM